MKLRTSPRRETCLKTRTSMPPPTLPPRGVLTVAEGIAGGLQEQFAGMVFGVTAASGEVGGDAGGGGRAI